MARPRRARPVSVTVYLGADGLWHGYLLVGTRSDGKPDRRHRSGKTKVECEQKIRDLEDEVANGRLSRRPGRAPTVEEWFTTWLSTIANRPPKPLRPRTLDDYWSKCRNWIFPHLGAHRIDALEAEHLDLLYTRMYRDGKAASHVLKVHAIIRRGLEVALRREKVRRNVAKLIDSPPAGKLQITPFGAGEARAILEAAQTGRNAARWSVGFGVGLRQGEALGLLWPSVDLDNLELRIEWQLQRLTWEHGCRDPNACGRKLHRAPCSRRGRAHKRHGDSGCPRPCPVGCNGHASRCPERRPRGVMMRDGEDQPRMLSGGLALTRPKDGERTVPLPPELVPVLRAHRKAQLRERIKAGSLWQDHDLVFATEVGGPIDPRRDYTAWIDLLEVAGVRHGRIHDGRHTAGTLLLELGVDIRVVQDILGHSDLRMTQQYTKATSQLSQDAAARIGGALFGPSATDHATRVRRS